MNKYAKMCGVCFVLFSFGLFFFLHSFGYVPIETALELTKYLAKEDELFVWNMVLLNLIPDNLESTLKNYEVYPLLKV